MSSISMHQSSVLLRDVNVLHADIEIDLDDIRDELVTAISESPDFLSELAEICVPSIATLKRLRDRDPGTWEFQVVPALEEPFVGDTGAHGRWRTSRGEYPCEYGRRETGGPVCQAVIRPGDRYYDSGERSERAGGFATERWCAACAGYQGFHDGRA